MREQRQWVLQIGCWISNLLAKNEKISKMANRRNTTGAKWQNFGGGQLDKFEFDGGSLYEKL